MIWYAVYFTATGEADSFGTVLADPMPDQFSVKQLSDTETAMLLDGTGIWSPTDLAIIPRPEEPNE
jgi:hypothetical protein